MSARMFGKNFAVCLKMLCSVNSERKPSNWSAVNREEYLNLFLSQAGVLAYLAELKSFVQAISYVDLVSWKIKRKLYLLQRLLEIKQICGWKHFKYGIIFDTLASIKRTMKRLEVFHSTNSNNVQMASDTTGCVSRWKVIYEKRSAKDVM